MAWCCQSTSHYLRQCWPRSVMLYGVSNTMSEYKMFIGAVYQPWFLYQFLNSNDILAAVVEKILLHVFDRSGKGHVCKVFVPWWPQYECEGLLDSSPCKHGVGLNSSRPSSDPVEITNLDIFSPTFDFQWFWYTLIHKKLFKIADEMSQHIKCHCKCHFNMVSFLRNPHNRHSIARPWGQGMGCLL